jgi:hypothetical protein
MRYGPPETLTGGNVSIHRAARDEGVLGFSWLLDLTFEHCGLSWQTTFGLFGKAGVAYGPMHA